MLWVANPRNGLAGNAQTDSAAAQEQAMPWIFLNEALEMVIVKPWVPR